MEINCTHLGADQAGEHDNIYPQLRARGFAAPLLHYTVGEELCVWIKLKDGTTATEDDIRAFCRCQITHFKIPRYLRFVDEYPMTVTGKVQKFVMREMTTKGLTSPAVLAR